MDIGQCRTPIAILAQRAPQNPVVHHGLSTRNGHKVGCVCIHIYVYIYTHTPTPFSDISKITLLVYIVIPILAPLHANNIRTSKGLNHKASKHTSH